MRTTNSGRKHYASYKAGVNWIATRTKELPNDLGAMVDFTDVNLLAVIFGTSPAEVATDVVKRKIRMDEGQ